MVKGWFIGEFEPAALKTSACEVSVKRYKAGDKEDWHYHKKAEEVTVVVSGKIKMQDKTFSQDDIIVLDKNEKSNFEAITDAVTVAVKVPGVKDDKFY